MRWIVPALLGVTSAAAEAPLRELPPTEMAALAPVLRNGDLALIESHSDGRMRQVTVVSLVAAAPSLVRQVVATPEKWPEFARNLSRARVERRPDGWIAYNFALDLRVVTLDNDHRMRVLPDGSIEARDQSPDIANHYKWMFVPAPGGTVLVHTGYTDLRHAGAFARRFVEAVPTLEHGMSLATQLYYVRAVRGRAEQLAAKGSFPPPDPTARSPGFGALMRWGRVVVIRSGEDGRLAEFSILDTVAAARERVEQVLLAPREYRTFVDGMKTSEELSRDPAQVTYRSDQDLPLITWTTTFAMRRDAGAVDVMGLSGDLRGSRYRWDLAARGPKETLVTLRARADLTTASPILFLRTFN